MGGAERIESSCGQRQPEDEELNVNPSEDERNANLEEIARVEAQEEDEEGNEPCSSSCGNKQKPLESNLPSISKDATEESTGLLDDVELAGTGTDPKSWNPAKYEGKGQTMVQGKLLLLQQFWAIILKRYLCTRKNIEGLFSQVDFILKILHACV
jgi:hypothetical protein